MIIAACSCGQAITGDDRDEIIERTSEHLRATPCAMVGAAGHSALVGVADAKVALTVTVEPQEAKPDGPDA